MQELLEKYHQQALQLWQEGKINEAIALCYQSLSIAPDFSQTYEILGNIKLSLGNQLLHNNQIREAEECYLEAVKFNPNLLAAYQNLGEIYRSQANWSQAIESYQKVIALDSNYFQSYYSLGEVYSQQEKWEKAIESYQKAIALNPDQPYLYLNLGDSFRKLEKWQEAIDIYRQGLAICPEAIYFYYTIGESLTKLGQYQLSIETFNQALNIDPNLTYLHYGLGDVYAELKEWETAITYYQKAIEIQPDLAIAYQKLGIAWENLGDFAAAIKSYQTGLDQQPKGAFLYKNLGELKSKLGKIDEAIEYYQEAIKSFPDAPWLNYLLAENLAKTGQWQEAIASYQKTLISSPNQPWIYFTIANIFSKQKLWDQAITSYLKAANLRLDLEGLGTKLGAAWHQRVIASSLAETIDDYTQFISSNSTEENLAKEQGVASDNLAISQKTLPALVNTANPQFYLKLGELLEQAQQPDGAIVCYQIAQQIQPDLPEISEKITNSYQLRQTIQETINLAQTKITALPDDPTGHTELGNILGKIGELEAAAKCHQKASDLRNWPLCQTKQYQFTFDWFTHNINTWEKYLQSLADQPLQIVEIGSYEGMSTCWFLDQILTNSAAKITCIDIFYQDNFDLNISLTGNKEKVVKLEGNSLELLPKLAPQLYDIAYIDGCHLATSALADTILAWDLVKTGGMIIFDDYEFVYENQPEQNTKHGINTFLALAGSQVKLIDIGYQLIVEKTSSEPNGAIAKIAQEIQENVKNSEQLIEMLKQVILSFS